MISIASRVAVRRRYVRSADMARDMDDSSALDGYVVTPSVRDAAVRILVGLSAESRQARISSRWSLWRGKVRVWRVLGATVARARLRSRHGVAVGSEWKSR